MFAAKSFSKSLKPVARNLLSAEFPERATGSGRRAGKRGVQGKGNERGVSSLAEASADRSERQWAVFR